MGGVEGKATTQALSCDESCRRCVSMSDHVSIDILCNIRVSIHAYRTWSDYCVHARVGNGVRVCMIIRVKSSWERLCELA